MLRTAARAASKPLTQRSKRRHQRRTCRDSPRTCRQAMVLSGAAPAASLALLVDGMLAVLERGSRQRISAVTRNDGS